MKRKTAVKSSLMILLMVFVMLFGSLAAYAADATLTVSPSGVVSWEEFGDTGTYRIAVVNSSSQLVINAQDYYDNQIDLKARLDTMAAPSGDYKITVYSKKNGNNVQSDQAIYSYASPLTQLDSPTNLVWNGAVASWSSVANATKYHVELMDSQTNVITTKTVYATSYDFTSDLKNGAKFKVSARADGYLDSEFATSDPSTSYAVIFGAGTGSGSKDRVVLTPPVGESKVEYTLPGPAGLYSPGTGKVFSRWFMTYWSGPNKGNTSFVNRNDTIEIDGDIYLEATWKDETYTITLYASNGNISAEKKIENFAPGTYLLPNFDLDIVPPEGKEFDCWAIGSENGEKKIPGAGVMISDDTLIVAIWKDKTFTLSPKSGTVGLNATYAITYKLSMQPDVIYLEFYNDYQGQWASNFSTATMPESEGALTEHTVSPIHAGTAETLKFRIHAAKGGVSYYSDEFTVTWADIGFTSQPQSATLPLEKNAYVPFEFSIVPDMVRVQKKNAQDVWEFCQGAENGYAVISGVDANVTGTYRIEAIKDSAPYYSDEFTLTWSDTAEWAFTTISGSVLKTGDAQNVVWSVNFPTNGFEILIWDEEIGDWDQFDVLGSERAANEDEDYDFDMAGEEGTYKFKIVAYQPDSDPSRPKVAVLESPEFEFTWKTVKATFKANGGTGEDSVVSELFGDYKLPECTFKAPENKIFAGWAVDSAEGEVKLPGETVNILRDTEYFAVWADIVEVSSWNQLVEAIKSGKKGIKLTEDITKTVNDSNYADTTFIFSEGSLYIDFNGYTLDIWYNTIYIGDLVPFIKVMGTAKLTLVNGSIVYNNDMTGASAEGVILLTGNGTLITDKLNIKNKKNGSCVYVRDNATAVLGGGTLETLSGYAVRAMHDASVTLDSDVKLRSNAQFANNNVQPGGNGALEIISSSVTLNVKKATFENGILIHKDIKPVFENHVIFVGGALQVSSFNVYANHAAAVAAGAKYYWCEYNESLYITNSEVGGYYPATSVSAYSKDVKYGITVENGTASVGGNSVNGGHYYQEITIEAEEIEGKKFVEWVCESVNSSVMFADPNSATTTFMMCDEPIVIKAIYENLPISQIHVNFYGPIVGDMLPREATVEEEGLKVTTSAHDNPLWDIEWTSEMVYLEDYIFMPGKTYRAALRVEITDVAYSIDPNVTVYVNGEIAERGSYSNTYCVIFKDFTMQHPDFYPSYTEDTRAGLGGTLKLDGEKLENEFSFFGSADEVEYSWYKDGVQIGGAYGASYRIKPSDANSKIFGLVKVEKDGSEYYGILEEQTIDPKIAVINVTLPKLEADCYIPHENGGFINSDDEFCDKIAGWWYDTATSNQLAPNEDIVESEVNYSVLIVFRQNEGVSFANDCQLCLNGELLDIQPASAAANQRGYLIADIYAVEHTHTYDEETYGYDDDGHWKRCTNELCADRDEEEYEYAFHVPQNATCVTAGSCFCGKTGLYGDHDFASDIKVKYDEQYHVDRCKYCEETNNSFDPHGEDTANCKEKAFCEACGETYGELDANNHAGSAVWTKTATTHKKAYDCCGAPVVSEGNHEWENGKCTECEYDCLHADEAKDHECDICKASVGEHVDGDKNHACDYGCSVKDFGEHVDAGHDHICDKYGENCVLGSIGQHEAESGKHNCAYCDKPVSECNDANTDHKCDICGTVMTPCKDENSDGSCDICDAVLATTPAETTDASTPAQTTPVETPVATTPVETPVATTPVETPVSTTPVETPVATTPVETPVATTPVETPVATTPVETPVATTPVETPVATTPVETPVVTTPVETPVATTPVETPVATTPVETPVATTPVETPVATTPVETPVSTTPVETPVATTPVETPVATTPVETPVVTTPVETPPADTTPTEPEIPGDEGLPVGAVVAIVIGSTVVVGGGGFALFWFVIKKKSIAELLMIFKKK